MPYERFEAWKLAHSLALELYRTTDRWPRAERFELTAQLRRAALSVPANVAEGVARQGPREFGRFLAIALGSLSEVSYLLLFARDRSLLGMPEWERLEGLRNRVGKLIWGLKQAVVKEGG
jgi:four helix bundle protein